MKALHITSLALFLLTACTTGEATPDYSEQIAYANEQLLNQGNVDAVPELFAASYVSHGLESRAQGHEVIARFVTNLRNAFPDLEVEVQVLATEGDRVAWLRTHRGTHEGEFMGVPGTGRPVTWQSMIVTRYEEGLIAEEWAVSDLGARLRAP